MNLVELPLKSIHPSPTNPRKHFDAVKLSELAMSIKERGVINPILVRPCNGQRRDADRYELVAGERRFRASKEAGLDTIPAIVRELEDREVLELQVIENLQRDDLHPMEEAEGYHQLIKAHAYSASQIGEKVGKTKSYINKTLQLLQLSPKAREAFLEGRLLRSTALLLARIPAGKELQDQALGELLGRGWGGDVMSPKRAAEHIQTRYMLRLKDAPFDTRDAELCAKAGPCSTCPKRAGNQKELFDDVQSGDTCTDPGCYKAKVDAHWERLKVEAQETGVEIIEGSREGQNALYSSKFVRAGEKAYELEAGAAKKTWAQNLAPAVKAGDIKPVYVRTDRGIVTLYPKAEAREALGLPGSTRSVGDDGAEHRREQEKERAICDAKIAALVAAAEQNGSRIGLPFWQYMARAAVEGVGFALAQSMARRRAVSKKGTRPSDALAESCSTMSESECLGVIFEAVFGRAFSYQDEAFEVFGLKPKDIEREAVAKLKAAKATNKKPEAKAKEAAAPPSPAPAAAEEVGEVDRFAVARFEWNQHDVCVNPEVLKCPLPKRYKIEIHLAQTPSGQWVSGYHCDDQQGNCIGPPKKTGPVWDKRQQAIGYEVGRAVAWLGDTRNRKTPKSVIDAVRAWATKLNAEGPSTVDLASGLELNETDERVALNVGRGFKVMIALRKMAGALNWASSVSADGVSINCQFTNGHASQDRRHAIREAGESILVALRKLGAKTKTILTATDAIKAMAP